MIMKKKVLLLALVLCLAMFGWACGNDDADVPGDAAGDAAGDSTTDEEDIPPSMSDLYKLYDGMNMDDYVKLGDYKGIKVEEILPLEITDEHIQAELDALCAMAGDPGRPIQEGDTARINYAGRMDGKLFDGGSGTTDLVIGSGQFIDGFEEGLIGASVGESVELQLNFPDPYTVNPDYSGAPVEFTVVVTAIAPAEPVELTDAHVARNTEYNTVEEYKAWLLEELTEISENEAHMQMMAAAWTDVVDGSKIKKLPEEAVAIYAENVKSTYEYYAAMAGMSYDEFVEQYSGATAEDFNKEIDAYAEAMTTEDLVFFAILRAENMSLTDEEYEAGRQLFITENLGYADEKDFYENVGKDVESYLGEGVLEVELLRAEVQEMILENAEIK
ncbi:MAG: hypothetical protein E7224_02380 [Clostridiales bacterium]|nr:hypothetical protein [Clostridiales bacterium]